jgi:hypothetical protein
MSNELRWYKGKYTVAVLVKGKKQFQVEALETVPFVRVKGETFVTIPRLLWRHKKVVIGHGF